MQSHLSSNVPSLPASLANVPPLLDLAGINKYIAPLGRTTLYTLASSGEIESASIGLKRGKRVFVTASVIAWIERRMAASQRPKMNGKQG